MITQDSLKAGRQHPVGAATLIWISGETPTFFFTFEIKSFVKDVSLLSANCPPPVKVAECAFTLGLMAVYWLTEALPVAVTALLPAMLFPLFGIMKSSQVAAVYFKDFHLLLTGVICLATAIEKWNLHRRIALRLVNAVGVHPGWLMLGFMIGCAFLSMWLSNTSAVAMVMPIVEAVIQQILTAEGEAIEQRKRAMTGAPLINGRYRTHQDHMMCKGLSLCIAYASSIGGMTTLPGTSPNLIFAEYIHKFYPKCTIINFGNWFVMCLPISIIVLLLSWLWLHWLFLGSDFRSLLRSRGQSERDKAVARVLQEEYNSLGPMSRQEIITIIIFILMAVLWFFRDPGFMPGWAALFPDYSGYATDATVALLLGLLFFIIPANRPTAEKYEAMISWKDFQSVMPWEIGLLVGGGFALAEGTKESGLSSWVANLLTPIGNLPPLATITIACIIVTSITEVASNAATMTIFLPILAPLAETIHINPLYMLIPTTLCVSFSFLLPVSNPPNAIVFSYGHLSTLDMVKAGLGVNIIGVLGVLLAITTWAIPIFDLKTYPDWAPVVT
uniref:Solute carrier family 13 member 1 n=1 Tax=Denticeps clupeoides TaxID=299321 RepID=A0AAY4BC16_9TELE